MMKITKANCGASMKPVQKVAKMSYGGMAHKRPPPEPPKEKSVTKG